MILNFANTIKKIFKKLRGGHNFKFGIVYN